MLRHALVTYEETLEHRTALGEQGLPAGHWPTCGMPQGLDGTGPAVVRPGVRAPQILDYPVGTDTRLGGRVKGKEAEPLSILGGIQYTA